MTLHSSPILLLAALLMTFVVLMAIAGGARAHGDAGWIMANPGYVDEAGVHCCGPSDCRRESAVKFREAPEGVYVAVGAGDETLMPRGLVGHGLYASTDDDWWICVRAGVIRCIFKPTTGG